MTRLDPTSLRYFIRVVEQGTIAGAAELEHITAAAISKRINDIEAVFEAPLLIRTNKGVLPTADGSRLLALAKRALNELDQIPLQMHGADNVRGLVRVFASTSVTAQFLPAEIRTFLEKYPDVKVNLAEKTSVLAVKAVMENSVDIGIFTALTHSYDLETYPYRDDRLVLLVSGDHPLASHTEIDFAQALEYDFVGFAQDGSINHQLVVAANAANTVMRHRIQVTSFDACSMMVSYGLGVAVVPALIAERYSKVLGLTAVALSDPWSHRQFRLGVRSLNALPIAARRLFEHLREHG
jgi:DNA-binding transcriptional LysR family regulator